MVEVAVMGFGTVGSGVVDVVEKHADSIEKRAKVKIGIKYILDLRDFPGSPYEKKFIKSFDTIINDPDIKIVVEVMGGINPAFEYTKRCLSSGKSVVTSNKELVAAKGAELLKIAKDCNTNFLFEASVGGGIPIIRPISQCLAANDVVEIAGILNGTTNFILTKMIREKKSFSETLALAQKLGYAERNPDADIKGYDACRKICILASLAYGKHVYPEQVHTEGIENVTLTDVEYASAWGGVVKLIGKVRKLDSGKLQIIVCPMFLPNESQLANIDDVFNGILVRGDAAGDVVFYGRGAGKYPTASAVVADIIDCAKHLETRKYLFWGDGDKDYIENYKEYKAAMYIRAETDDEVLAFKNINNHFGSVERLIRKNPVKGEIAFVTKPMKEKDIDDKLKLLSELGVSVANKIRISDL